MHERGSVFKWFHVQSKFYSYWYVLHGESSKRLATPRNKKKCIGMYCEGAAALHDRTSEAAMSLSGV
jgi:hypothetical protein